MFWGFSMVFNYYFKFILFLYIKISNTFFCRNKKI